MPTPVLLLAAAFVAGFFAGFAVRSSWRSYQRKARYRIHVARAAARPSRREQPVSAFGHVRRAF